MALFRRRLVQPPVRVLTAAATRLDLTNRQQTQDLRGTRQGWQEIAWDMRDSVGELRYAVNFLANCAGRMRVFPAIYPIGGEDAEPIPIQDAMDDDASIPRNLLDVATQAQRELGSGRQAMANLLRTLSTNHSVAGEEFLLGQENPATREQSWSIRSIDEIVIRDGKYQLHAGPSGMGGTGLEDLDPALTVVSRMWLPHPRFAFLADSPCRAIVDECESLLIHRRMIRAEGRSRLAGRGILLLPDELTIKVPIDDDMDPEADPVMAELTKSMLAPIAEEGSPSGVVPIVLRGPAETLAKVQHIDFASKFDALGVEIRAELVGVIATGFDLPKAVVEGVQDMNHWSAWQVDDSTFRHHVEPHVIEICDSLTAAHLRPYLADAGVPPEWARRLVYWYDPTELVTHPDQTKDAMDLHDRLVISDQALLRVSGFGEDDAPTKAEIQVRLLEKMRMWPPNLVMAFLHQWDPTLIAPPITVAGTIPGIKQSGVDVGEAPVASPAGVSGPSGGVPAVPPPPPATAPPGPPVTASGRDELTDMLLGAYRRMAAVTAAGAPPGRRQARLSRQLAQIDRDLRVRLQTAASGAMLRALERAGAHTRSRVAKDETLRAKIAHRPNERVTAILGRDAVVAAGLPDLINPDWGGLRGQFFEWTEAAQQQALTTALRIAGAEEASSAAQNAARALAEGRDRAWTALSEAMTSLAHNLLYSPDPNGTPSLWGDLNPNSLVPTGTIRAALGIAGGNDTAPGTTAGETIQVGQDVGQIGTGATITALISQGGGQVEAYEWQHGAALKPFEPHLELDGVQFASFDDEVLANTEGWPDNSYFLPGDHDSCSCDASPIWLSPADTAE